MMYDDDNARQARVDHAAEVRSYLEEMEDDPKSPWVVQEAVPIALRHLNAITAERDALIRYARALENKWWNEVDNRIFGHPDMDNMVEDLRAEHGVAALLEDDPT